MDLVGMAYTMFRFDQYIKRGNVTFKQVDEEFERGELDPQFTEFCENLARKYEAEKERTKCKQCGGLSGRDPQFHDLRYCTRCDISWGIQG